MFIVWNKDTVVKKIGSWKGVEHRGLKEGEGEKEWVRRERREVELMEDRERERRMEVKSSLQYYRGGGTGGWAGIYDGNGGSNLLFRARVGAPEETGRRMRWKEKGTTAGYVEGGQKI
jgi:hypothetical protein